MTSGKRIRRGGFSLMEVLVVIAIIAILVSLLLPAIQQSREAARRTQCQNNLRQIGLALQNYHGTHESFPPGHTVEGWGWGSMLLPFVEQPALHDQLEPGRTPFTEQFATPEDYALLQTPLPVFVCPSDTGSAINQERPFRDVVPGEERFLSKSNYPGNNGDGDNTGVFPSNSAVSIEDITDGTSNTLMCGERRTAGDNRAAVWGGSEPFEPSATSSIWGLTGSTRYRMYDGLAGGVEDDLPQSAFGSAHSGGSYFALCDGSVRFVSETIEWVYTDQLPFEEPNPPQAVYNRLGHINDGQAVGSF